MQAYEAGMMFAGIAPFFVGAGLAYMLFKYLGPNDDQMEEDEETE